MRLVPAFALLLAHFAGCAAGPGQVTRELLDDRTGTTLKRLPKPVELLRAETTGAAGDPFAYFGPFQTNRMGAYALYLWVAVPVPDESHVGVSAIVCEGKTITLVPITGALADLGLSSAPYAPPAPWSRISYYALSYEDLQCLQHASRAVLTLNAGTAGEEHFQTTKGALSSLVSLEAERPSRQGAP